MKQRKLSNEEVEEVTRSLSSGKRITDIPFIKDRYLSPPKSHKKTIILLSEPVLKLRETEIKEILEIWKVDTDITSIP